jgi:predicted metal-dependent hydrolase
LRQPVRAGILHRQSSPMMPAHETYPYHLAVSTRHRRIRLRVSRERGLEVVIPRGCDPASVPALVERHRDWIRRALDRLGPMPPIDNRWRLPDAIHLPALGRDWSVSARARANAGRTTVRDAGEGRLLISGNIDDERACRLALGRWLQRLARRHLVPALQRVSREIGMAYRRVQIRRQRTRWGSCSRDGTISLNANLLFLPPETVEYVLIHELCHRVELNHSTRFWRLVERHCPDYRRHHGRRRELWQQVPRWADAVPG